MHMKHVSSYILLLIISLWANNVKSTQTPKVDVIWATDSWPGFTDRDGTGFYHEIFARIFDQSPYKISVEYLPWKRALHQVELKKAHVSGALPKNSKYLFADMPILTQPLSIITHSKTPLTLAAIKELVGVWPVTYVEEFKQSDIFPYLNGVPAQYRPDAMALLQKKKVDYYLDIRSLLESQLAALPREQLNNYHIHDLSTLNLYLIFSNNEQGKALKQFYDSTTKRLLAENILQPIYKKYNLTITVNE